MFRLPVRILNPYAGLPLAWNKLKVGLGLPNSDISLSDGKLPVEIRSMTAAAVSRAARLADAVL